MPRLIWGFAGRTLTLLVLLCRGSSVKLNNFEINGENFFKVSRMFINSILIPFKNSDYIYSHAYTRGRSARPLACLPAHDTLHALGAL